MNTLKLSRLRIKNFKGIKNFELNIHENDTTICGMNEAGKTTIVDGFSWLLFNKDSSGKTDFSLKPLDENNNEINFLDTEVEADIIYNSEKIKLMKRFREKWTKKRGSANKEFTGHETKYFIDEVPSTKKILDKKIDDIIDVKVFKLVTDPHEFNGLHWSERRKILIEMCGDVDDEQIIKSNNELQSLSDVLGTKSIDDIKAIIKEKHKKINYELKEIPVRIDELSLSDVEKPPVETKASLDSTLKKLRSELSEIQNDEAVSKKQIRINMIDSEIIKLRQKATDDTEKLKLPIIKRIHEIEFETIDILNSIEYTQNEITRIDNANRADEKDQKEFRDKWHSENEKSANIEGLCPTCGQDMPADKIKSAIENFNLEKAKTLQSITDKGKKINELIESRNKEIDDLKKNLEKLQNDLDTARKEKEKKEYELNSLKEVDIDTAELGLERIALVDEIEAIKSNKSGAINDLEEKISEVEAEIEIWNNANAAYNSSLDSKKRIEELKAKEKELAAEYENLESDLFLIEQFTVKKVEMLNEKINGHFGLVEFKMFNKLINGGMQETCVTTYKGVPWHDMNSAAKINCGLDIIKSLSGFYGFKSPIWIDNRESVTEIIDIDTQIINLVVSPEHKELTVL